MTLQHWQERNRPTRLEKRYEFDSYDSLRTFLDRAAELSEARELYPDIGFGRTHANFTIHADQASERLTERERGFAALLDTLETTGQE